MLNDLNLVLAMKLEEDMIAEELALANGIAELETSIASTSDIEQRSTLAAQLRDKQRELLLLIQG